MMNKNDSQSAMLEQLEIYKEKIVYNKLDKILKKRWNVPDRLATEEEFLKWKHNDPVGFFGLWKDVIRLTSIIGLPQDKEEVVLAVITNRPIPLNTNKIETMVEDNPFTGGKNLWIKINKTTSINDVRKVWGKIIKPLQSKLDDKNTKCDNFFFDKRIYKLKKSGLTNDRIMAIVKNEFNQDVDYKLINDASNRYKKIVTIKPEILSTF